MCQQYAESRVLELTEYQPLFSLDDHGHVNYLTQVKNRGKVSYFATLERKKIVALMVLSMVMFYIIVIKF